MISETIINNLERRAWDTFRELDLLAKQQLDIQYQIKNKASEIKLIAEKLAFTYTEERDGVHAAATSDDGNADAVWEEFDALVDRTNKIVHECNAYILEI